MRAIAIALLGACGFQGNPLATDAGAGSGEPDAPPTVTTTVDGGVCPWTTAPTNMGDPCTLPITHLQSVNGSQDFSSAAMHSVGAQPFRFVRLDELVVPQGQTLTLTGALPMLIAVDGMVNIAGTLDVRSGANLTDCMALAGTIGHGNDQGDSTSGGGAGAAASSDGGKGGDGAESGDGASHASGAGSSSLTPPRAGCKGGSGGTVDLGGGVKFSGGDGGDGGGATEIASETSIMVTGKVRAMGHGGNGGPGIHLGAGGGGSGGSIFLEAPVMAIGGTLCADGGAGGLGGGDIAPGLDGDDGHCDGNATGGANTGGLTTGGEGGDGGARKHTSGTDATDAKSHGGGGGGGGGVGWIRIHQLTGTPNTSNATITPDAELN